jgi:hypothetical protein
LFPNFKRFVQRSPLERRLLIEAFFALAWARLTLADQPFPRVAERLGRTGAESPASVSAQHEHLAAAIGQAIEAMARHTPWQSRCLAQALAAWQMLQRRGIAVTVYFGVAQHPAQPCDAHAWVRCGSQLVTGGAGHEQFRVISSFAHEAEPKATE